ncbi:MAG: hypothetical protein AB1483_06605 [Candidatus Zixiibacteriota bacterium]
MSRIVVMITFLIWLCAGVLSAQEVNVTVGELKIPGFKWGAQPVQLTVTNNSDYMKFVVSIVHVEFSEADPPYSRNDRFHDLVQPGMTETIEPLVYIPGSYGPATITIDFYDVVDTLDAVSAGEHILHKVIEADFPKPDTLKQVFDTRLVFPSRVEEHPYFESEFSRLTLGLLAEGKSPEEIHELTGADRQFVLEQLRFFAGQRLIVQKEDSIDVAIPVISKEEGSVQAKLADRAAQSLAGIIAGNMPAYRAVLDSLVAAKVVPTDSTDVLDDAVVLYKPYPVVTALVLWNLLGTQFIAGGNQLDMFWGLDICNLPKMEYLYAAPEGPEYNGRFFYAFLYDGRNVRLISSNHPPRILCSGNFPPQRGSTGAAKWRHDESDRPEYIMLDPVKVVPALETLAAGTSGIIDTTLQQARNNAEQFGRGVVTRGYKLWLWNLVVTKVTDILMEQGVLPDPGEALYVFSVKKGN